jgi:hypothetical protein
VFARRAGDTGGYGIPPELVRAVVGKAGARPVAHTACAH